MKKLVFVLLIIMLLLSVSFSATAFAVDNFSYEKLPYSVQTGSQSEDEMSIDDKMILLLGLPYGVQTEPQSEKELSAEAKNTIQQKLITDVYPDSDINDIAVRCYGTLSNGAMLINHYNKSYVYPENANGLLEIINVNGFDFCYYAHTMKDRVYLFIDGEFYTFEEAYNSELITYELLWEIEHSLDYFCWYKPQWDAPPIIKGDVDNNGVLTVNDATLIQKSLLNFPVTAELNTDNADVNDDGKIDVEDVTFIQKLLVGM